MATLQVPGGPRGYRNGPQQMVISPGTMATTWGLQSNNKLREAMATLAAWAWSHSDETPNPIVVLGFVASGYEWVSVNAQYPCDSHPKLLSAHVVRFSYLTRVTGIGIDPL